MTESHPRLFAQKTRAAEVRLTNSTQRNEVVKCLRDEREKIDYRDQAILVPPK